MKNLLVMILVLVAIAFAAYTGYHLESKSYDGIEYIVVIQNSEVKGICRK